MYNVLRPLLLLFSGLLVSLCLFCLLLLFVCLFFFSFLRLPVLLLCFLTSRPIAFLLELHEVPHSCPALAMEHAPGYVSMCPAYGHCPSTPLLTLFFLSLTGPGAPALLFAKGRGALEWSQVLSSRLLLEVLLEDGFGTTLMALKLTMENDGPDGTASGGGASHFSCPWGASGHQVKR